MQNQTYVLYKALKTNVFFGVGTLLFAGITPLF